MGLAPILLVLYRLLVPAGTTCSLLQGHRSHTASTAQFTGSRLVLRVVSCKGFIPTLPVLLRLLVYDWYYVQLLKGLRTILPVLLYLLVHN
jgi:hypothetical protein